MWNLLLLRVVDGESEAVHEINHHSEKAHGRGQDGKRVGDLVPAVPAEHASCAKDEGDSWEEGEAAEEPMYRGGKR